MAVLLSRFIAAFPPSAPSLWVFGKRQQRVLISAARCAEVVRGDAPTTGERVRVCQSLTEMHAAVEARCRELCGVAMGAHAFPAELPTPTEESQGL